MNRNGLLLRMRQALLVALVLIAFACEVSANAFEKQVAASHANATESNQSNSTTFGRSLSAKAAMDALFEVVGEGARTRYIWKNIDAAPQAAKNRSIPINQRGNGEVWELGFKELGPDRAILVTGLTQLDEHGEPDQCHACSGRASVFFFSRNDNQEWLLASVEMDVAQFGSHGGSGSFSFVELGPGRPGFLFDSGGTWQGYTVSLIDIFEIGKDNRIVSRTEEPGIRVLADHPCEKSELSEDCFSVEGKWKFVPGPLAGIFDLVIDFTGYITEEDKARRDIHEQARYRLDGQFFLLVEGENPVPEV